MKRIFASIMILLLAVLTVTGCGNNGLADYKKAVEKTGQIAKGQNSSEFSLKMEFNTEGLSQEAINDLNYYDTITGSFHSSFDTEKERGICRNYLNLGGLGLDFDIYKNGNEFYAKLPIVGKYMMLDDFLKETELGTESKPKMISEDTMEALTGEWVGILNEEDVFRGKDIVLTTPDGEVKTTIYTITLDDSQVKVLEKKSIDILSEDENLRNSYMTMIENKEDQPEEADFDGLINKMKEHILKDTIESFEYTAYVDIDGYIVNETVEVKISRNAMEPGEPKSIDFRLDKKNWDINKNQKFEFPVLTDDNTMKQDELDKTMPSMFKNLFQAQ